MPSGDRLVLYASVWRRVFGVAEVISEPTRDDPIAARWPWSVQVELLLVVAGASNAPPVEAIGVAPRSMSQHSHIRLQERHLELAIEALAGSAGEGERVVPEAAARSLSVRSRPGCACDGHRRHSRGATNRGPPSATTASERWLYFWYENGGIDSRRAVPSSR